MATAPTPTQPKKKLGVWKGMTVFQLERYGIKVNDQGVWIPYYKRDNTLFRAKLFTHDGRSWWLGGQGRGQIPYGLERLGDGGDVLILTEGESDTLALRLAWPDSIVAIGIPGASSWRSEWAVIAKGYDRVYLSFDGDEAGSRLTSKVAGDLPDAKCLHLPAGADTRDVVQRLGKPAFKALIDAAEADALYNRAQRQKWKVHDLFKERVAA